MIKLYTVGEMTQIFNGQYSHITSDFPVKSFKIDSRKIKSDDWFFCIKGENTDGHHYIQQALDNGAVGIIANKEKITTNLRDSAFPLISVESPNISLLKWAADVRKQFSGQVLGITGSNGKTTTKEILAALCRLINPQTHATSGNFNNFIGTPLTLLDATHKTGWWVIEMGTNQFGEIAQLSKMVQPTAAIITNIGESHIEFLKNTNGVAKEKTGIFDGMRPESKVVIPDSILHLDVIYQAAEKRNIQIHEYPTQTKIQNIENQQQTLFNLFGVEFSCSLKSPLAIQNLISALTLLHLQGIEIKQLQQITSILDFSVKGRFQQIAFKTWTLIDDTYNANPSSFISGLQNLKTMFPTKRRIVVCGAMAELGKNADIHHQQVGECMQNSGITKFYGLGNAEIENYCEGWTKSGGSSNDALHFNDMHQLIEAFQKDRQEGDVVLVKGSRSTRMERFVEAVQKK